MKPNPLTPFPSREGGKFKSSLLAGERFGEGFSRSREKSGKYQVPVTQVVIFLQETRDDIAFIEEYISEVTTHRYRVIRMWEQDSEVFLSNLALLPLAPLTRTDSAQLLLSQRMFEKSQRA